jgi:hypothetical protein
MIYRIIHLQSNLVYVGSTFQKRISDRWMRHKYDFKQYLKGNYSCSIYPFFEKYGIQNFKIILIRKYKVCDRSHLQAYEQLWINKLQCVNKTPAFQPLKKQCQKIYREQNKETLNQYQKQYRENNKQKIKQYQKQYQKQKTYCYDCECYLRKNDIKKHYKTIKHLTNCLPVGL